jgi:hypothetical protein
MEKFAYIVKKVTKIHHRGALIAYVFYGCRTFISPENLARMRAGEPYSYHGERCINPLRVDPMNMIEADAYDLEWHIRNNPFLTTKREDSI